MAYSDFKTLEQINEKLGIVINEANNIYSNIEPIERRINRGRIC